MPYEVVRPFAYGAGGIHGVELVIGDVREDFGVFTAGLLAEGYIVSNVTKPVIAVETVAEREVAIDAEPVEFADEHAAEVVEPTFEMSEPVAHEAPRRGRKRK
jgi:hypothetical protein